MLRTITEIQDFTTDEVETIIKSVAKAQIVGHLYIGSFDGQTVERTEQGYRVITTHAPGTWKDFRGC